MVYDIDLTGVSSREELHERLKRILALPDWYGGNLDALRDLLGEGGGERELRFHNASRADESMSGCFAALRRMLADTAAETPGLAVLWEDGAAAESPILARAERLRNDETRPYNCAQAVLIPFAEAAGLDGETACRLAANFGAGMKRASVCGAVTGGLMALGLLGVEDGPTIAEYHRRLRHAHDGCLDCADLLRRDRERGGDKKTHCDGMVYECAALAEELARRAGKL